MKKIFLLAILAGVAFAGCKKKESTVSVVYTYSAPIITIAGAQYYSIPVGGALPTISATAYDTFYLESYPVILDQSKLDNLTPGLYTVLATAKNRYGMTGTKSVYVAVTGVSDTLDVSGWYIRNATPGRAAHITKLATGMFMTDNVGGVDTSDATTGAKISAVFVATSLTDIDFGSQVTTGGPLTASSESLSLTPPVTISYAINLSGFGTAVRTFIKQ